MKPTDIALLALLAAALPAPAATTTVEALDNPNGAVVVAAGDTLVVTGNVASTGDSTSARFDKQGAGTLVLQGANNSFKRIKHTAGTLVFDGGATTVAGGTGKGVANDEMNVVFVGDETKFTGGATFTMSADSSFAGFFSKATTIENATVDASAVGELLANFRTGFVNKGEGVLTIGAGGLVKAKAIRPHQNSATDATDASAAKYGMRIVDGGVLELVGENTTGLGIENERAGFVLFDGGVLRDSRTKDTYFPNRQSGGNTQTAATVQGYWKNTPIRIGEKGATVENATAKKLRLYVPFASGAENDGGLHLTGKNLLYIDTDGNSFNGGVHLDSDEGLLFAPEFDGALGAVPEEPKDAIFANGSSALLFGDKTLELNANRNVRIAENRTFNAIAKDGTTLTIHGEVNGAHEEGALPTTTVFKPGYRWTPTGSTWKGGVVALDPGENRTNSVGRLNVEGKLEIKSGVTVACAPTANKTGTDAPVWVHGTGAAADDGVCGVLVVSGGALEIAEGSKGRWFEVDARGTVDVCGGELRTNGGEYLNALASYGQTIVRDGGVIDCGGGNFRVVQAVSDPSAVVVRLATNGLIRCNQLSIDKNKTPQATFLFDGGWVQSANAGGNVFSNGRDASWAGVKFAVGPGGAGFDVPAGHNAYLYQPLASGVAEGEKDGGLMIRGPAGTAACLMTNMTYTGSTTIDGNELQQRDGDDLLPAGTDIALKNGGILALWTYGTSPRATAATLGGVSGDGYVKNCSEATFAGTFAPSVGGTVEFQESPKAPLSGTLLVSGDATGCGTLKFHSRVPAQDISGLTLAIADVSTLDKHAEKRLYKIFEGSYTGRMALAADWPDDWAPIYREGEIYLTHVDPLVLVVR